MNSDQRLLQWQKRQLMLALIVTCLLAVVMASLAWLNHVRSLQTATWIYVPSLWIDNAHGTNTMNLGEIDVQNAEEYTAKGDPCRRYVFAVCSNSSKDKFRVQLAYTTNIPFTYTIYPARENDPAGGDKTYTITAADDTYNYYYSSPLSPKQDVTMPLQNHDKTYGDYSYVHTNAEPKYWVSDVQSLDPNTEDTGAVKVNEIPTYARYFVLEISWSSTLVNNKETDMVYLMAENAE